MAKETQETQEKYDLDTRGLRFNNTGWSTDNKYSFCVYVSAEHENGRASLTCHDKVWSDVALIDCTTIKECREVYKLLLQWQQDMSLKGIGTLVDPEDGTDIQTVLKLFPHREIAGKDVAESR